MRSVLQLLVPCVRFIRPYSFAFRFVLIRVQSQFLSKMFHIKMHIAVANEARSNAFSFCILFYLHHDCWHHYWASVRSWPQTNSALNLNGKFTMIFALFRIFCNCCKRKVGIVRFGCVFSHQMTQLRIHSAYSYEHNDIGAMRGGKYMVFYCGYYVSTNKCPFLY